MNPQQFGKVAVLMGGNSAEREISLMSGRHVLQGLKNSGVAAFGLDLAQDFNQQLQNLTADRAFIVLHGRDGEDGVVQAILDSRNMPYTGSGVMASALAMDKIRSKWLWRGVKLPVPDFVIITTETPPTALVKKLGLPMVIKPSREGSSLGITIVRQTKQIAPAYAEALKYDTDVIAEQFIQGHEFSVAILADTALPAVRIETPREFYDYQAKYFVDTTKFYSAPCGLDSNSERQLQQLSLRAFTAGGCHGWGRVDCMQDQTGNFWLLENNTAPGMTEHSLVPMAAAAANISFTRLLLEILQTI